MGGRAPLVGGFVFGFERNDVILGVDCFDSRFAFGLQRVISRAQRGVIVALVGVPGVEDRKLPAQRLRMVQPAIGVSDHSGKVPLKVGHRLPRQGRAFPERFERALRMARFRPGHERWQGGRVSSLRPVPHGLGLGRLSEAMQGVPTITAANLAAIRTALEADGVVFVDENGHGPGVRLRKATTQ